jgi:hypothetical protein
MTVIATASNPDFEVSRIEIDRPGDTYTVDTMLQLREMHGPRAELFFISGADAVREILGWKDAARVAELCTFIAATRPGFEVDLGARTGFVRSAGRVDGGSGAGDLFKRHPGPRGGSPSRALPAARGRGGLHREERVVP